MAANQPSLGFLGIALTPSAANTTKASSISSFPMSFQIEKVSVADIGLRLCEV